MKWHIFLCHFDKITKLRTQKGWVCFIWFYEQYSLFKEVFNTMILLELSLTAYFLNATEV